MTASTSHGEYKWYLAPALQYQRYLGWPNEDSDIKIKNLDNKKNV